VKITPVLAAARDVMVFKRNLKNNKIGTLQSAFTVLYSAIGRGINDPYSIVIVASHSLQGLVPDYPRCSVL